MKTAGVLLVATLLQAGVVADTNTVFVHFGIGTRDTAKRLLSAQVRFNEPIFVAGDNYVQLTGRVEKSGQTITADLLGSNGQQSSYYKGPATLEKLLYAQGGGSSGGVALMWFVLSTNSNCTALVEALDAIRQRNDKEIASTSTTNASLAPQPTPLSIDLTTGLPMRLANSPVTVIDPNTGLPIRAMLKKAPKTAWSATQVELASVPTVRRQRGSSEKVVNVFAREATYEVVGAFGKGKVDLPIIAFADPKTKRTYLGRMADVYVETSSNIFAGAFIGESLFWEHSLVPDTGNLEQAAEYFEQQVDMQTELERENRDNNENERQTPLWAILGNDFFTAVLGASNVRQVKVIQVIAERKLLQIDLESPSGAFTGTVWIDLHTRRPVRAVRGGREVFHAR